MAAKDSRSLSPIAQEDLRGKAVRAIAGGMTQEEAAKLFGVTRQAIIKWLKKYREGGERALRARRRGRPKRGSLEPWQAAQIVRAIEDRCPDQLKLPFFFVDAGGCWGFDCAAFWYPPFGLDRGPISGAMGFYSAEAGPPSV